MSFAELVFANWLQRFDMLNMSSVFYHCDVKYVLRYRVLFGTLASLVLRCREKVAPRAPMLRSVADCLFFGYE